jgi:MHS family proline/betaine transporter-like MFS transporter
LANSGTYLNALIAQLILIACAGTFGVYAAVFTEAFPTNVRYSGFSAAYNFAQAIFGGFAPFAAQYLIQYTGSPIAPAYLLMAGAAISFVPALLMRETAFESLK